MDAKLPSRPATTWSWLLLLKTPAIALRGRVLLLAALGLLAVWAGDALLLGERELPAAIDPSWNRLPAAATATAVATFQAFVDPFRALAKGELLVPGVLRCIWRIAVWGLLGGAIVRIAAMSLTRDETPDVVGAMRFAWYRRSGFWGGPLLLLAGLAATMIPLAAVRAGMQSNWFEPVAAVLWPVVIVCALIATIYTIASVVGWPLIWAAAATDDSDAFDGVSRMFAYVYQKPLPLLGYAAVVVSLGAVGAFAAVVLAGGVTVACSFAAGETASPWAASVIDWWTAVAASFATVYLTAYLWTAAAGVYLLRRQDVDGVQVDEVFIDPAEFSAGLPELATNSAGVPTVASDAA